MDKLVIFCADEIGGSPNEFKGKIVSKNMIKKVSNNFFSLELDGCMRPVEAEALALQHDHYKHCKKG